MNIKLSDMTKAALLALLMVVLAACSAASTEAVPEDFSVTMEKSACHGICPVYSITVKADGTVTYNGLEHVALSGEQSAVISEDEVDELVTAVQTADFFSLEAEYTIPASDLPAATTTVTMNGQTKSVYHYGLGCGSDADSAPTELCDLETMLEDIAIANGWVAQLPT